MNQTGNEERERNDREIVSAFMAALADTRMEEPRIPPAGQTWWRAHLLRRQAMAEKAMRPLVLTEGTAVAMVALGGAIWLAVRGVPSMPTALLAALVAFCLGLSAAAVTLTVRRLLARD